MRDRFGPLLSVFGRPVDELVRPRLGIRVSLRAVGLFMAGIVTISGHVGTGLDLFGPLAMLPTVALLSAVGCLVLLLPRSDGGGRALLTVFAVLVVTAPGILLAGDHEYASAKLAGLVTIVLPLLVIVSFLTRKPSDLEAYWLAIYLLASLGVGVAFYEAVSGVDIGMRGADTGASLNPIAAGRLGGTVILITLLGRVQYVPRVLQLLFSLLATWVLLGAASRGPLLALIVAVVATTWGYRALRGRMAVGAAIVAVALIAGVGNVVLSESAERLTSANNDRGDAGRSALWERAIEGIADFPEGAGWGAFSPDGRIGASGDYPHNIVLEMALEAGMVAAVSLLLLIAFVGQRLWRNMRFIGPMHFALLVFWLVTAQFSSDMNGNRVFLVTLFGLYAAFRNETAAMFDLAADQERDVDGPSVDAFEVDVPPTNAEHPDRASGSAAHPALTGASFREEFHGRR
jgi:hypothetical protein